MLSFLDTNKYNLCLTITQGQRLFQKTDRKAHIEGFIRYHFPRREKACFSGQDDCGLWKAEGQLSFDTIRTGSEVEIKKEKENKKKRKLENISHDDIWFYLMLIERD